MTTTTKRSAGIGAVNYDAIRRRALNERAEAMRALFSQLGLAFRRLAGKLRPAGQRLPQSGRWAGARF